MIALGLEVLVWVVAVAWVARVAEAAWGLPQVADLSRGNAGVEEMPSLVVIVPARNEEADVRSCLESLLGQDYLRLRVIAVDDRSTDATGAIMDEVASSAPGRMEVMPVRELPAGWLGKTHAMAMAARSVLQGERPEFLLFTDGDIVFRADALRRAVSYAMAEQADHVVLAPTTLIRRWDEGGVLTFFQVLAMWGARPWKVRDPRATRDAIGIGAFNMLRADAYEGVGGYEALRMEIVEDLAMGKRVKEAGLRQRFCYGRGLVNVHWAAGVDGIVNVMTKNLFAVFRFRVWALLGAAVWLVISCMLPFVAIWSAAFRLPAGLAAGAIVTAYFLLGRKTGISGWYGLLAPLAAGAFVFAMLRSMAVTLRQGGVIWRGTFYSLAELREFGRREAGRS